MQTRVHYQETLPTKSQLNEKLGKDSPPGYLVIYDKKLVKLPAFKKWLGGFQATAGFDAGEKLKDLKLFPKNLDKAIKSVPPSISKQALTVIAVGGGSLGDFAGFIASIWKRGVNLVHIPSTWLSAIDSAHGGKTALNLGGIKNQFGTVYPADHVFVVQDLLKALPQKMLKSAAGELGKMALIDKDVAVELSTLLMKDFESFWNILPTVIAAKYKIVNVDPDEKKGFRQVLNLGHTIGHIFETLHEVQHGEAVGCGVQFALTWSYHRGYLKHGEYEQAMKMLFENALLVKQETFFKEHRRLKKDKVEQLLQYDKKIIDRDHVQFVFVEKIGSTFTKKVTLDSLLTEAERQGWIRA